MPAQCVYVFRMRVTVIGGNFRKNLADRSWKQRCSVFSVGCERNFS